jgi:hypothetical protein
MMEMDYGADAGGKGWGVGDENEDTSPPSKLHPAIQDLVKLIFDKDMMTSHMLEIGYDANKVRGVVYVHSI